MFLDLKFMGTSVKVKDLLKTTPSITALKTLGKKPSEPAACFSSPHSACFSNCDPSHMAKLVLQSTPGQLKSPAKMEVFT